MDFGSILDKWEEGRNAAPADAWARGASSAEDAMERRRRLLKKKPDAELDLHGQTQIEARIALESFFRDSRERGLEKVQVIHGKGNHSAGEAVLRRAVMDFVERCPFAGESGSGKARSGGAGATWVLLKEAPREG